ncbi:putative polygalacturonase [Senna tora]|uniref:endo-polygalacturonase n=1 Tax=Senna tora TaxID=362788 RepID=A0A834XF10_9FABA|nr:putative polygalacturonase [Senna tora]
MMRLCSSSSTSILAFIIHIHLLVLPYLTYTQGSTRFLFVTDYGALGDGLHDDTKAFQDVWKIACAQNNTVRITNIVFPYGRTFLIYPTDIVGPCHSKVTFEILGAIIAPKDPDVWEGLDQQKWISFRWIDHLAIDGGGSGTINGMGQEWWARSCKINPTNACRLAPTAISFYRCRNLRVRDLMVLNSQQIHVAFIRCLNVFASDIRVSAPASSPNTDGIHVRGSRAVDLKNILIKTGDDCVSIGTNSSKIRIRNISCGPGHGISVGSLGRSNSLARVQDIMVDGAYLYQTKNGVRVKTWQGGGGLASKITFKNVLMEKVSNPIKIDQYYCDSSHPCKNQSSAVKLNHISFINIRGTSASEQAIKFACSDSFPCENLHLEDIFLVPCCGGMVRSSCWEAHGYTSGVVHPSACSPDCQNFFGPQECKLVNQIETDNQWEEKQVLKKSRGGLNQTVEANSP